jgi:GNAT superfamily N-acetyltransferase
LYEAYQRRGIGRRLIAPIAQSLLDVGLGSLLVWVLEANRFVAFTKLLADSVCATSRVTSAVCNSSRLRTVGRMRASSSPDRCNDVGLAKEK